MSVAGLQNPTRAWFGRLSHLLLAALAALLVSDLLALQQPAPVTRQSATTLSPSAPLPVMATTRWQDTSGGSTGIRDTALPLSLVGRFRAEPLNQSLVVIGTPDGQVMARIGDRLMPGVTLDSIRETSLIIDHKGQRERLRATNDSDSRVAGIQPIAPP